MVRSSLFRLCGICRSVEVFFVSTGGQLDNVISMFTVDNMVLSARMLMWTVSRVHQCYVHNL